MKTIYKFALLFTLLCVAASLSAQVTIGSGESPARAALLQLKDREPTDLLNNNITSTSGGFLLPRVNLVSATTLQPFMETNVANYSNEKLLHAGLLVYNMASVGSELIAGICEWDGEKWNQLKVNRLSSISLLGCGTHQAMGLYATKKTLDASNYVSVNITVSKAGSYSIVAKSDVDNGYYYMASGEFFSPGDYTIMLTGMGTPKNFGSDTFQFYINGASQPLPGCQFKVSVDDSAIKPFYTIDCNSTKVNGVYKINTPLIASNTISMTLNVDPLANGARYDIKTNTVDGISFAGSGILVGGTNQVITLYGKGTPTSVSTKTMTISTNSELSVATCSANVTIAFSKMRILFVGYNDPLYGYNFNASMTAQLINTQSNYGLLNNSIVKSEGIERIDGGNNPSDVTLNTYLNGSNPVDILVVSYSNTSLSDATQSAMVARFLANGGTAIMYQENTPAITTFMRTLFNDNSITATPIGGAGNVFAFSYDNHDILRGPFRDIRGLQWGEDASSTVGVTGLPTGSIIPISTDSDISGTITSTGKVVAFVHRSLNLVWVGDGGFNSANALDPSSTACPFRVDASGFPIAKSNYGRGATKYQVYNSSFTANALTWAIGKAQEKKK